jgi:hypothetical protein
MTFGVGVAELTSAGGGRWALRPEEWIDGQLHWVRQVLAGRSSDKFVTEIHLGDPGAWCSVRTGRRVCLSIRPCEHSRRRRHPSRS